HRRVDRSGARAGNRAPPRRLDDPDDRQGHRDTGSLRALPNVRLIGQKRYEDLPAYCRAFDVGIIPFRIDELTVRANPLKLREYLAAGLPVVSSDLPEVRKYAGLVRLAAGPEGFVDAIEGLLAERTEARARARVEAMRQESWEAR